MAVGCLNDRPTIIYVCGGTDRLFTSISIWGWVDGVPNEQEHLSQLPVHPCECQ